MTTKDTKRERREEAKRARLEAQRRAQRKAAMRKVYGGVAAVLIIGLIAFLVINSGKDERNAAASLAADAAAAGCTAPKKIPEMSSSEHITPPATETYSNNPPTSGRHYTGPANSAYYTGVIANEVQDEYVVHNLEHGHIVIHYTDKLAEPIRTALEGFTKDNDTTVLMAPRSKTPAGTVLTFTAWNQVVTCNSPSNAASVSKLAEDFHTAFLNKAPETVPGLPNP